MHCVAYRAPTIAADLDGRVVGWSRGAERILGYLEGDALGLVVGWNPGAAGIFGYTTDEILGQHGRYPQADRRA